MVPGPLLRAVRAALFAAVCVGVGATLHTAADGCHVSPLGLVLGLLGASALGYAGLGSERGGPALTAGLGAGQVGLHYLFAATCTYTAPPDAAAMRSMPNMPATMTMTMPAGGAHLSTTAMLLAHTLAVVVCGWWMRHGEREAFALCRAAAVLAAAPLRRLLAVAAVLAAEPHAPAAAPRNFPVCRGQAPRRRGLPLLTALTFRGPPVAA